jgi:PAS domain S-box-containing protein
MRRQARLLALPALLIVAGSAAAAANEPPRASLVYVGGDNFAPYQYADDEGVPRGFLVELLRALAREADFDVDIRLGPWRDIKSALDNGHGDIAALAITESRAGSYTHVLPVWHLQQVVAYRGRRANPPRRIEDLKGEVVAVTAMSSLYEDLARLDLAIRPAIRPVAGVRQALDELRAGRATMAAGNALAFRSASAHARIPDLHESDLRSVPFCLVARRGREQLVPQFFAAYSRLQESGELTAIVERTLLTRVNPPWWDGWAAYLAASLGIAACVLFGFLAWTRSLRTQVEARTGEIRAVAERLAFHGHILSQVSDAIIVLTPDRRLTFWNTGAETMFGLPASTVLGRQAEEVLDTLASADDLAAIRRRVAESGSFRGEIVARGRNGTSVYVQAIVQELRDKEGRPAGRIVVAHDISALKRAEQERRRLEQHLQQVQKLESLGVLAGGIAHDFNNLLVGMLGHAGLALSEIPPGSPLGRRIRQIETCALRAAELTNQMLAYSGKGRFVVEPTDLTTVVREMSNLLGTAIRKGARLDLRLADSLPAMSADPTQIRQVVMNLITNASDAIGAGVGTITVTTGTMNATCEYLAEAYTSAPWEAGEYVFLEVRDTGCGMDAETQQRIFDPFFTTKASGRGLGLAAVLGIVRGHRGVVRLESAPGEGTTFRILFPATGAAVARPSAAANEVAARRQARVLVVDDEPSVRAIARESLARAGFSVLVAEDGPGAVARIRSQDQSIDAVLMDMTMPGMDGVEAMRAMRELVPDLPIILTSGYSEQEAQERCAGAVFTGFIQKPFAPSALVAKMNEVVAP